MNKSTRKVLKKAEVEKLLTQFPQRYRRATYSGEIKLGQVLAANDNIGTVIAIDLPERDYCVIDLDIGQAMLNHLSAEVRTKLQIMDQLTEEFGPLRIFQMAEISSNGKLQKPLTAMELDKASFTLLGDSSDQCLEKLSQFVKLDAKKLTDLFRKQPLKKFIDQFQD